MTLVIPMPYSSCFHIEALVTNFKNRHFKTVTFFMDHLGVTCIIPVLQKILKIDEWIKNLFVMRPQILKMAFFLQNVYFYYVWIDSTRIKFLSFMQMTLGWSLALCRNSEQPRVILAQNWNNLWALLYVPIP